MNIIKQFCHAHSQSAMAMWVMMHPVHWAILATLALLASRAAAVDCQQLANSTEGCDFYTQCLEVESPCGPQGYALGYGDKYCVRFGEYSDLFDEAGQEWIKKVRLCLKTKLYNNTAVYNSRNCSLIIDYAFSTHPTCYVDSGFCHIVASLHNLRAFSKVFVPTDFFSKRALAQVFETAKLCLENTKQSLCALVPLEIQPFCEDILATPVQAKFLSSLSQVSEGNLKQGETRHFQYQIPPNAGITIMATVESGEVSIYGSFAFKNPTALTSDFHIESIQKAATYYIQAPLQLSTKPLVTVHLSVKGLKNGTTFSFKAALGDVLRNSHR